MDIATGITAATAALQTVRYIAELDKVLSQAELKSKMAALYTDLADVRMALTDARETVAELRAQVGKLEDWQDEKRLYTLSDAGNGVLVYRFDGADQSIPAHDLCPNCFVEGRKSILQPVTRFERRTGHLICHSCKNDLTIRGMVSSPVGVKR